MKTRRDRMTSAKVWVLILGMVFGGTLFVQPLLGAEYPAKPIEIICHQTPGSSIDLMARIIADLAPK